MKIKYIWLEQSRAACIVVMKRIFPLHTLPQPRSNLNIVEQIISLANCRTFAGHSVLQNLQEWVNFESWRENEKRRRAMKLLILFAAAFAGRISLSDDTTTTKIESTTTVTSTSTASTTTASTTTTTQSTTTTASTTTSTTTASTTTVPTTTTTKETTTTTKATTTTTASTTTTTAPTTPPSTGTTTNQTPTGHHVPPWLTEDKKDLNVCCEITLYL